MKSLFNTSDNDEIVSRINRLTGDTKPQWGKMGAGQMLVHASRPLQVAYGDLKLKRTLVGVLFGNWAKKNIVRGEAPFRKNLPTDKNFVVKDSPDFEDGKKALIALVRRFAQVGPTGITKEPHPFFGKMTDREWDLLMWKHLDHHLRQFGV